MKTLSTFVCLAIGAGTIVQAADDAASLATFKQYCFQCHGKTAMGGISLEKLTAQGSMADNFQQWDKVAAVLEQKRMPPEKMPQPPDADRRKAAAWVRTRLNEQAMKNAGDPGRVTIRRLTSGEYGYAIRDLTGFDLEVGIDASTDTVGGEGFTNFGDVQFMQDANVERYLEAAKRVADHAVIGAGPIEFYSDPGQTGMELSAINRIRSMYMANGFRTVSGEGGRPYGLEKYGKAFYIAWYYKHRAALGEPKVDLKTLAGREKITTRFATHIWTVLNTEGLGYPSVEMAARWRKLPAPADDAKATAAAIRKSCEEIQQFLVTWPSWLFARGDLAAGGAGDESPLEFSDRTLGVKGSHQFRFNTGGRFGGARQRAPQTGPTKIYLNVAPVNPAPGSMPVVIWRNPTIAVRRGGPPRPPATTGATPTQPATTGQAVTGQTGGFRGFPPAGPRQPLRSVLSPEEAKKLNFGVSPDGTPIGPDDFATTASVNFEVPVPEGAFGVEFQAEAVVGKDRDQVFRILLSDRADGATRGAPTRALLGDPQSSGYKKFRSGVMEFASLLPPNSHGEPTPADKDPVPAPFDNTYNVPEHDEFVVKVKYIRDDKFVFENMLDPPQQLRVTNAWNDLYASFEYHDNYLRLLAKHYKVDLKGKSIADIDQAVLDAMNPDMRQYVLPLRSHYQEVMAAQKAAQSRHIEDCMRLANNAWRRSLTEKEKQSLRAFYDKALNTEKDHRKAIRALIARILVAPQFLYRVETVADASSSKPLAGYELASRLSFFLWASIPDEELLRAAAAGELNNPQLLEKQTRRMLADPKARRMSTEFFGQWLGFYHFDEYRGVDTKRFPEFTDQVKAAMYDEAVSFFEHIVRKDRPVREILSADYTFLNQTLAKHYGVKKEIKATGEPELVEGANAFQRGGMLRLGAVLTTTSAPLRTSPVKRGDWLLRRVLNTPTPPPPADAGSIPADDKLFGGMTLKQRLQSHQRNATCAGCHTRIDPLGFPLERYDSVGRYREMYADGKPIEDTSELKDKTSIAGVDGLIQYLKNNEAQVLKTMSAKLLGYALGRTMLLSDQPLIERLTKSGGDAPFSKLVTEIVTSRQFRYRRGQDAPAAAPVQRAALESSKGR